MEISLKTFYALAMLTMVSTIIFATSLSWIRASHQASVYNRLNNTEFTTADFFWAKEQLNVQTQTIKLD